MEPDQVRIDADDDALKSPVERAFTILFAIRDAPHGEVSANDVISRTNLPKTTVHRHLQQLVDIGAINRIGQRYVLSMNLYVLGHSVVSQVRFRQAAESSISRLYARVQRTVNLAYWDGEKLVLVEKIWGSPHAKFIPSRLGRAFPLHCTAAGKVALAHLSESHQMSTLRSLTPRTRYTITNSNQLLSQLARIREKGFATEREEVVLGVSCIATPIIVGGALAGALSLSDRSHTNWSSETIEALRSCGTEIARTFSSRLVSAGSREV